MDELKVYTAEVIQDIPLPVQLESGIDSYDQPTSGGSGSRQVSQPPTIQGKPRPKRAVSHETLSSALNTKSRKITGDFQFTESGALSIGKYKNGISGDIRITPRGLTARDISGNTTVSIDAETGAGVFKGEVQAGDFTVIDESGLISLSSFTTDTIEVVTPFNTQSTSFVDVTGAFLDTDSLDREVTALILFQGAVFPSSSAGAGSTYVGGITLGASVNGSNIADTRASFDFNSGSGEANGNLLTLAGHRVVTLNTGVNSIKLQMKITNTTTFQGNGFSFRLTYLILGR